MCRSYLKLQEIYAAKARQDVECVAEFVKEILAKLEKPVDSIPREKIALMCKNARNLRLVRSLPSLDNPQLIAHLQNPETFRNASFALLLEAVDAFHQTHVRDPGTLDGEEWTQDAHLLMKTVHSMTDLASLDQELQSEIQTMALEVQPQTILRIKCGIHRFVVFGRVNCITCRP